MHAKHPGDVRRAGELPARFYRLYLQALKHGEPVALAHALAEWRRELARQVVTKPDGGLFIDKGGE